MITDLPQIIQNRRWERHDDPFPYVYAQGVFTEQFYTEIEREYVNILDRGLAETPAPNQFSRTISGYDAYGVNFDHQNTTGNLSVFLSPQWHDVLNSLFGVHGTGYINVGAHHHALNSEDGFVHNDLNPVWFALAGEGPIRVPQHGLCSYKFGGGPLKPDEKIEVVRSVVMIYYLANGNWKEGDGGETGFYRNHRDNVTKPARKIPPLNNSLIAYECTPVSWHSFVSNRRNPRNTVIMWTHRTMEDAIETWGEEKLERWK